MPLSLFTGGNVPISQTFSSQLPVTAMAQMDALGGEPLLGSGFEAEEPEADFLDSDPNTQE